MSEELKNKKKTTSRKKTTKRGETKKSTSKKPVSKSTKQSTDLEKTMLIPRLEPSQKVDFDVFEEDNGWQEKKKKLLEEHVERVHQNEEHQKKVAEQEKKRSYNGPILLVTIIVLIALALVYLNNVYFEEIEKQRNETEALNKVEDNITDEVENSEKTLTCTSPTTQMDTYQSSVLTISRFENDRLVTYEYIVTRKYNDQGSYDSAKLENQNQNDIIFDNNQLIIKTYFGDGHQESVAQETTYLGKSLNEVKAEEEATGATCVIE